MNLDLAINKIIELITETAEALTKSDFLNHEEKVLYDRYGIYCKYGEVVEKLEQELGNAKDEDKAEIKEGIRLWKDELKSFENDGVPDEGRKLNKKLTELETEHIQETLRPLQKELGLYLEAAWAELSKYATKGDQLEKDIENYFVKGTHSSRSPDRLDGKKEEIIHELGVIQAKWELEVKPEGEESPEPAEPEQKAEPVKEPPNEAQNVFYERNRDRQKIRSAV